MPLLWGPTDGTDDISATAPDGYRVGGGACGRRRAARGVCLVQQRVSGPTGRPERRWHLGHQRRRRTLRQVEQAGRFTRRRVLPAGRCTADVSVGRRARRRRRGGTRPRAGTLLPVDVTRGVSLADQAVPLPANAQVQLGGGTVALLDPTKGAVWAIRVDTTTGVTGLGQLDTSNAA